MTIQETKGRIPARFSPEAPFSVPVSRAVQLSPPPNYMVGVRDIWAFLRRRFWLISLIVLVGTLLAIVVTLSLPKIYTATSTLVLERKDVRPFETDAATQSLERDRSAAETEMDVLRSRQFVGRIVDHLGLIRYPEFNPYAASGKNISEAPSILSIFLKKLGLGDGGNQKGITPPTGTQRDRAISSLLSQINVGRTGESLAVNVAVFNWDPAMAAKIANTVAELYVASSLEFKQDVRLADKERARTTGGAVGFLRDRVTQPLLITLRSEEARLARERAELGSRYGKNHPSVVDADSQIVSVRKMIDDEVQRILQDLETEALKPSARIVSLAEVPTSPSFPKPIFLIPAAVVTSILLAVLLAIILEATDTRIRSGDRIAQLLQVPNFGYVPRRRGRTRRLVEEALRLVYLASRGPNPSKPLNLVLVAACLQGGSSAATARGIAEEGAADGRNVLFVDLDSPAGQTPASYLWEEVDLTNNTSLCAILNDEPSEERDAGFTDATSRLSQLCRVLNTKKLSELFSAIGRIGYDFIVLHAPPVLAIGDANRLSPFVDGVILAVTWARTTEDQLIDAANQLRLNQARLIGTVIDEVDPRVQARHGHGGTLKYYRQMMSHMRSRA